MAGAEKSASSASSSAPKAVANLVERLPALAEDRGAVGYRGLGAGAETHSADDALYQAYLARKADAGKAALSREAGIANPTDQTGIEVKSGSTPTNEGLAQLAKDEIAVQDGWTITWQLKVPLSQTLMTRLQELADEYPGVFTYTVVAGR